MTSFFEVGLFPCRIEESGYLKERVSAPSDESQSRDEDDERLVVESLVARNGKFVVPNRSTAAAVVAHLSFFSPPIIIFIVLRLPPPAAFSNLWA